MSKTMGNKDAAMFVNAFGAIYLHLLLLSQITKKKIIFLIAPSLQLSSLRPSLSECSPL